MPAAFDFRELLLKEPPVAYSAREGLTVIEEASGSFIVRIGPEDAPGEMITIPRDLAICLARTLLDAVGAG